MTALDVAQCDDFASELMEDGKALRYYRRLSNENKQWYELKYCTVHGPYNETEREAGISTTGTQNVI